MFKKFSPIFTIEEELKLIQIVQNDPSANWKVVADLLNNKHSPRQCRDHWLNKLCLVQKASERLNDEELDYLFHLVDQYGLRFDLFSKRFINRSANELKLSYFRNVGKREKISLTANKTPSVYETLGFISHWKPKESPKKPQHNRVIFPLINPDELSANSSLRTPITYNSLAQNNHQEPNRQFVIKPNMMSFVTMLNSGADGAISVA